MSFVTGCFAISANPAEQKNEFMKQKTRFVYKRFHLSILIVFITFVSLNKLILLKELELSARQRRNGGFHVFLK